MAGQRGDMQVFLGAFDVSEDVQADTAGRFLNQLGSRWGLLLDSTQDSSRTAIYSDDGWSVRIPYRFRFEEGTVPGEAEFILLSQNENTSELVHRFSWVLIGTGMMDESPLGWPANASGAEREPLPEQATKSDSSAEDDVSIP